MRNDGGDLLAFCDGPQTEAITTPARPLLVLAGAGSGKTRVLTRRIAWRVREGDAAVNRVLALTFTRKAARELRQRLAALGVPAPVRAETFHSFALAELRQRHLDQRRALPALLTNKVRFVERVLSTLPEGSPALPARPAELAETVLAELEWAAARMVAPGAYPEAAAAAGRRPSCGRELVGACCRHYEVTKRRRGVLDFDDLLIRLIGEVTDHTDYAAALRWRFRHLFVDELQDTNPAQLALLEQLLGGRDDLFAVGDARQAIYGWNGADLSALEGFAERFPNATVLSLTTNYRSTPEIVAVADAIIERPTSGIPPAPAPAPGPVPSGPVPSVTSFPDDVAEAAAVAAALRSAHAQGRAWSHLAVLARTNAQLRVFEDALERAGVPRRVSTRGTVLGSERARAALAELRRTRTPGAFVSWLEEVEASLSGPAEEAEADRGLACLALLARDYLATDPLPSAEIFSAFAFEAARHDPSPEATDAVELVTFHRAKGLEWPVVFVAGMEDGLVPIGHAQTRRELEEERRLCYVAFSRAVEELHCSYALSRRFGQRFVERTPSPYLAEIEPVRQRLEAERLPAREVASRAIAASRAALGRRGAIRPTAAGRLP